MGSTNKTTNYELSQFIGTDKPSWLNDYDNDMLKIDTAMKNNATAAAGAQSTANTADGKADANATAIGTLDTQINTPSTGLAAVVARNTSDIGTINGTIGNTVLPTTAQTITGAIAEVDTDLTTLNNKLTDRYVLKDTITTIAVTADGVKTIAALIEELYGKLTTYLASLAANQYVKILTIEANTDSAHSAGLYHNDKPYLTKVNNATYYIMSSLIIADGVIVGWIAMNAGFYLLYKNVAGVTSDHSADVPTTGNIWLTLELYEKI